MTKRPISITILAWLYIAIGAIGIAYHATEVRTGGITQYDVLWIELFRFVAIVCGVFMLRGANWARWVALAWMGFHVIVSVFHERFQLAVHCVFFAVIAWLLFRRQASQYFNARRVPD